MTRARQGTRAELAAFALRRAGERRVIPMSGIPGTVTGPDLPGGPEPASGAGDAFRARKAHRSYLEVAAEPAAVPHARRCTRHALAAWELGPIAHDAELVVSELMTNAVRATLAMPPAAHVVLYLAADPGRLTLLVWDACPQPPRHRAHDDDSAGGRGLEIVQACSDRWGTWAPVQGGKVVWAWFDLDRP
jgi:anti-sigma regulatory factor (Ser/Thr protein kinase)